MWLTVLGGSGGIPAEGVPCSGYLVEQDGFRLLVDPGYGSVTALLRHCRPEEVDAVYVSHGHPDHCADLNPLLRIRVMRDESDTPLPIYCPPGAVDKVVNLEPTTSLDGAYELHEFEPDEKLTIGSLATSPTRRTCWSPRRRTWTVWPRSTTAC